MYVLKYKIYYVNKWGFLIYLFYEVSFSNREIYFIVNKFIFDLVYESSYFKIVVVIVIRDIFLWFIV